MLNASRTFHARGWPVASMRIRADRKLDRARLDQQRAAADAAFAIKTIYEGINVYRVDLLFQQTRVAGHALPLPRVQNPCIGESSDMIVRFSLIAALCAV